MATTAIGYNSWSMWKKCLPAGSWKGVVVVVARVLHQHSAVDAEPAKAYAEDSTSKDLAPEKTLIRRKVE